ncbi:MAG: 2-oxoacid:ferredoxin oxidoreductase subunit beta [Chloroflexi bacterium]|nr:2-oxoacid:ferredoxin oxidoreductase subunit beta [Chloroflexota bacterium]
MIRRGRHPLDDYIRPGRLPHIWCPGCGLGITTTAFINAVQEAHVPLDKLTVVSGIGCTGRIAGYLNVDSFHTTHGRAIPFATGLKIANPELKVVVISGDGDLFAIGGNHFIHAARRNLDIKVICVNNFNYGMTGGQMGPTTPLDARSTTSPGGNLEPPFNLPYLAKASGAVFVARWTVFHVKQLRKTLTYMLEKPGFCFVEVISPCPTVYGALNKTPSALEMIKSYKRNSVICHGEDPDMAYIGLQSQILVGQFVDIERPVFTPGPYYEYDEQLLSSKSILKKLPWARGRGEW